MSWRAYLTASAQLKNNEVGQIAYDFTVTINNIFQKMPNNSTNMKISLYKVQLYELPADL